VLRRRFELANALSSVLAGTILSRWTSPSCRTDLIAACLSGIGASLGLPGVAPG
jgi:hypothetical protein